MPSKVLTEEEKAAKEKAKNLRFNLGSILLMSIAGPYVYYACKINAYIHANKLEGA